MTTGYRTPIAPSKLTRVGKFRRILMSDPVEIEADLSTAGAVTTITDGLPNLSEVTAAFCKIEDIAGADSTGATVAIDGTTVLSGVGVDGSATVGLPPTNTVRALSGALDVTVTLTGGSDNTPTAGKVRLSFEVTRFEIDLS